MFRFIINVKLINQMPRTIVCNRPSPPHRRYQVLRKRLRHKSFGMHCEWSGLILGYLYVRLRETIKDERRAVSWLFISPGKYNCEYSESCDDCHSRIGFELLEYLLYFHDFRPPLLLDLKNSFEHRNVTVVEPSF